jgi:hypothetical protein
LAPRNCNLEGFSVERMMTFLTALGFDVDIVIRLSRTEGSRGG